MKTLMSILIFSLLFSFGAFAQHGHKHKRGGDVKRGNVYIQKGPTHVYYVNNRAYYKHKNPHWAPRGFRHRHVYFPAYHCYYDSYTGYYIYRQRGIWIYAYQPPVVIVDAGKARYVEIDDCDYRSDPQVFFNIHVRF